DSPSSQMLCVKPNKGLASLIGWVSLALTDPRAMKDNRHTIAEAGIGHLLEQFGVAWEQERQLNWTDVTIATYEYAGRRCRRVQTVHPTGCGEFRYWKSVVYFDTD